MGKEREARKKHMSPGERAAAMMDYYHLLPPNSTGGLPRGGKRYAGLQDLNTGMLKLCKKYQVDRNWFSKQALKRKKAEATGGDDMFDFLKRTAGSGRPRKWEKFEIKEVLFVWARAQDYDFTYDEAEAQLGIPKSTFNDMIKRKDGAWKELHQIYKPILTEKHWKWRLAWAKKHRRDQWVERAGSTDPTAVDIDEKWFNVDLLTCRRLKIPGCDARPFCSRGTRISIVKVMILAAVARPNKAHNFDGKVGMWRVAVPYTAINASKNHAAGDVYPVDCTMDGKMYYKMMTELVFPAMQSKLTWATKIRMQQDNAPPHTGKDMVGRLNLFGKAMTIPIEVEPQPSNSPETNTLDLSVFNSWCRRNHKLQKYAKHKGKEALMDNLEKSWAEYPAEILERAFQNKCLVIDQIIKYKGGNYFRVPHVTEEAREKRCPSLLL